MNEFKFIVTEPQKHENLSYFGMMSSESLSRLKKTISKYTTQVSKTMNWMHKLSNTRLVIQKRKQHELSTTKSNWTLHELSDEFKWSLRKSAPNLLPPPYIGLTKDHSRTIFSKVCTPLYPNTTLVRLSFIKEPQRI